MSGQPEIDSLEMALRLADEVKRLKEENEELKQYRLSAMLHAGTEILNAIIAHEGPGYDAEGGVIDTAKVDRQMKLVKEYSMRLIADIYGAVNINMKIDLTALKEQLDAKKEEAQDGTDEASADPAG